MEDITRKEYYKRYYVTNKPKYPVKGQKRKFEKPDLPEPIKINKGTLIKFE
jgi:hypothetical protein